MANVPRRRPTNHWRLITRSLPAVALYALSVIHASKAGRTDVPRHRNPRCPGAAGQDEFGVSDHHPEQDASERGETVAAVAKAAVKRASSSDKRRRKSRSTA